MQSQLLIILPKAVSNIFRTGNIFQKKLLQKINFYRKDN
jgi:hypothetical protein